MDTDKRQAKYLDPKNDLTFRKIFGQHPHIVRSFLNSMLPLEKGREIEEVTYLEPELVPELPNLKRSIVDVRCTDNRGRHFIVEMQMYWTSAFKKRMLFNTGKAYVRQLKGGGRYRDLQPVYGLSLVDDIFHTSEDLKDTYYHHYRMVHAEHSQERIEGLELVFVELPKFKTLNFTDKKMQTLWLRFLTEIDENTQEEPQELSSVNEIKEALEYVSKDAFSEEELLTYDAYWDAVRVEKAAIEELKERNQQLTEENIAMRVREQEARRKAEEERKQAEEERKQREEAMYKLARRMKKYGEPIDEIVKETGLSKEEIEKL